MVKLGREVRPGDSVQFMGRFVPVSEVIFSHDYNWVSLRVNQSTYARVVQADEAITVNASFEVKVGDTYRTNTGRVVGIVDHIDGLGFIGVCGKHRIVYNASGQGAEDNIVELHSAPPKYAVEPHPYSISGYKGSEGSTVIRATCNHTGRYAESFSERSAQANREAAIKALKGKLSGVSAS